MSAQEGAGAAMFLRPLLGTPNLSLHPSTRKTSPMEICFRLPMKPHQGSAIQTQNSPLPRTESSQSQTIRLAQAKAGCSLSLALWKGTGAGPLGEGPTGHASQTCPPELAGTAPTVHLSALLPTCPNAKHGGRGRGRAWGSSRVFMDMKSHLKGANKPTSFGHCM